ncbi:MAG: alpha/beta hydrolase [Alphaproteobacteria bacterium]|nr:alpha/beta hydrolase [Alphaproteobacteria bacterium]
MTGASEWARGVVIVLACALATGCTSRPTGILRPIEATAPGAALVDLLVATTRRPTDEVGVLFSGERGRRMSLTAITVSIPAPEHRTVGEVQWPMQWPPNPEIEFATVRVRPVEGPAETLAWMRDHLPENRRLMIFVHGFNNRYEDAVYRFAQIAHDSGADVAPIVFTWPSRASVFDYNYDRESANYSRDALEAVIRRAASSPEVGEITILAHSMGSWLAVEALRQMAIRDGRVAPRIANVILASPDLDVDVFAQQWRSMGSDRPKFTLFVSQDDRALRLSRRISGGIDRLGQMDPTAEPYRSALEKSGITVIDLTALESGDRMNHGKFASSPEIVRLIGQRLVTGQTITDSDVGLGARIGGVAMGAAQSVGSAAAIAVTAPIAIFDPGTRRTYDEQIRRLGRAVGNTIGAATGQ